MKSSFVAEMPRIQRNIFLIALTLLSFGLQVSANVGYSHTTSAIETIKSLGHTVSSRAIEHAIIASHGIQSQGQKQLVAEIAEEVEEVNPSNKTSVSVAVSHAYFTSFLDFGATRSTRLLQYFDASRLVSSTPLYLQHEVFRL